MPDATIEHSLHLGLQHQKAGRMAEAETVLRGILTQHPHEPRALHLLGMLYCNSGRAADGEQMLRQATVLAPTEPLFPRTLGRVLMQQGRLAEAETFHRCAALLAPEFPGVYFDLAMTLEAQDKVDEAIAAYEQSASHEPGHAPTWSYLGNLLRVKGRMAQAIVAFEQALAIDPGRVDALRNMGVVCDALGRHAQAAALYERALVAQPADAQLHYNLGCALAAMEQHDRAVACFRTSLHLEPAHASALNNLGISLRMLQRYDEAVEAYRAAVRIEPDLAAAHTNLAELLALRAELGESLALHRRAVELSLALAQAHSSLCYRMLFLPELDARAIAEEHRHYAARHSTPLHGIAAHGNDRDPERPLRIGFVSAELRDHVVGRNVMPLFRERDRRRFAMYVYSAAARADEMTAQFQSLVDGWREIRHDSAQVVAAKVRADGIDILIDLTLHMADSRLPVFAHKPAPVQATFAGYPGTTGLDAIDYRISDPYLDPPGCDESVYSEKTIRLPETFWCYDPLGDDVPVTDLPARGAGRVTFGCLNNFGKTNEPTWSLWARVLRAVDGSRLMLLSPAGSHRDRTAQFFGKEGVSADRIIFCPPLPRREYLRLYHQIDVGLDTLPYNGHTTSLDSLWMGVPVVTQVGQTVVGRAGYSQLMNLGMPELIAREEGEFVQIATGLARDLPRMEAMRRTLRGRMEQSPLMDAPRFARGIEAALREMWRAWCGSR